MLPLAQSCIGMRTCTYIILVSGQYSSVLLYLQSTLASLSSLQVKEASACAVNVIVAVSLVVSRSVAMLCTLLQPIVSYTQ